MGKSLPNSPLGRAIVVRSASIVYTLLHHSQDLDRQCQLIGKTPLMIVASNDRTGAKEATFYKMILESFLSHDANVSLQDDDGNQVLHHLARQTLSDGESLRDERDMAYFPFKTGAVLDSFNNVGETPLLKAVENLKTPLIRFFLERGVANLGNSRTAHASISRRCTEDFKPYATRVKTEYPAKTDLDWNSEVSNVRGFFAKQTDEMSRPESRKAKRRRREALDVRNERDVPLLLDMLGDWSTTIQKINDVPLEEPKAFQQPEPNEKVEPATIEN